jgi:hypothetical protein
MKGTGQRGESNIKAILALVLFLAFVYAMFKIAPHFMNKLELEDYMETEARFLSYNQRTETEARGNIINKARALGIPTDDLKISKDGRRVRMRLAYTVTVEFPGYTWTRDFLIEVENSAV